MLKRKDEQLIVDYLKGDEKALEILIQRYLKPIFSFVYRYTEDYQGAEDVTQEVFVKAWRNIKNFKHEYKFKTWIFAIAKNASLDWLKKKKPILFSGFEDGEGETNFRERFIDSSPLPDELFERANMEEVLNAIINQLVPQYRMVLFLRYNDHFTFREIAEALGKPLNTIKSQHRRGIAILKKLLRGR